MGMVGLDGHLENSVWLNYFGQAFLFAHQIDQIMLPFSSISILDIKQGGPNPKYFSPKLSQVLSVGPLIYIQTHFPSFL